MRCGGETIGKGGEGGPNFTVTILNPAQARGHARSLENGVNLVAH